jgi:S1-C subfamily serine protease
MKTIPGLFLALLLIAAAPTAVTADEYAEKARAIWKQNQHAVVTVQLVVKSKLSVPGGREQSNESRQEITGTVIDAEGLTVVSLSSLDPAQMVQNFVGSDRMKLESELADLKILLPDGNELPAVVALRDKDLDLAFIRPRAKPEQSMTFVDLANAGKAEIGDPIVSLNRLGNAAGRAYSIAAERISAIVQRPRMFYVPDANMTTTSMGCPAITMDGKILGIFVIRATRSGAGGGGFNSQNPNYTGIILPATDVLKIAKQVPERGKEPEEPKISAAQDTEEKSKEPESGKNEQQ